MQLETMYSELQNNVATVVLNRPRVLNCANEQWIADFTAIVDEIAASRDIRVVVLRAAGPGFCSGIDLTALSHGEIDPSFFLNWETSLRKLESMDAIVIAAIHSHCIGGGLQLALACDLRVAREDARFGITAVKEGIIPGIGMWRIARHAGIGRAKRLALAADVVDAQTALAWGLIDYVAKTECFDADVSSLAYRLLEMAWTSTRLTKKLINQAFDTPFEEFVDLFCRYQQQALASPEHQEAMAHRRSAKPKR
jgi:enoyl-CoA hydratase/carnithine racemase